MIRITIQMIPKGDESRAYELGRATIANDSLSGVGTAAGKDDGHDHKA